MAETRKFSLGERLTMVNGQKMQPNTKYHIKKLMEPREVESRGRKFFSIIAECEEGFFFLPNVITNSVMEDGFDACRGQLEGRTFMCRAFESKEYHTKGITLTLIDD